MHTNESDAGSVVGGEAGVPGEGVPWRASGLAGRCLGWPLTCALGLLCVAQLLLWAPAYLTWPLWADHDVFATMARQWDRGALPYRDFFSNNFPGTTYLFWLAGKTVGWGRAWGFYAIDVGLVAALGLALLAWSRRRFGRLLPGLVAFEAILGYYLAQDYTQAAQRDWQGPCFAILGVLLAQGWPGRAGRLLGAVGLAAALVIRPQTVLFAPALMLAVWDGARDSSKSHGLLELVEWAVATALCTFAGFLPLMVAGVWGDFLANLKIVAYGNRYNQVSLGGIVRNLVNQVATTRFACVLAVLLFLQWRLGSRALRGGWVWVCALLCVALYKPLSPLALDYLNHPVILTAAVASGWAVGQALSQPWSVELQWMLVVFALSLGGTFNPKFCDFSSLGLLRDPGRIVAGEPEEQPEGYTRNASVPDGALYPWPDYRAVLDYLRHSTAPTTRVANLLAGVPAVNSPVDRPPLFPAESLAWLRLAPADLDSFKKRLAEAPAGTVVVWSPTEVEAVRNRLLTPRLPLEPLAAEITRHYRPGAKFGPIEVWQRKSTP